MFVWVLLEWVCMTLLPLIIPVILYADGAFLAHHALSRSTSMLTHKSGVSETKRNGSENMVKHIVFQIKMTLDSIRGIRQIHLLSILLSCQCLLKR